MEEQAKPDYRKTDIVDFDLSEKHFKHLRKAYLEGQLKVDNKALAEKIIEFERQYSKSKCSKGKKNRKLRK
ncbi:MAG: hypothetical protein PUP46_05740 [Endozoicomonas sp. (ex Botrylloides leachii)]|nr:hypothetical protein [Endozoicomonas sp. (ex Botrylloides leachii)]